ncbi:hypothetical protein I4U23_023036 [Adineta vaga]|nr:hypothetical protein I4U23_023036 [Adineta vaga]
MKQPRRVFRWLSNHMCNYNLFMPEEDEYDDEHDQPLDTKTALKYQKYATWLYVFLLSTSLYTLFYMALLRSESRTITISDITPDRFYELYTKHPKTLLCSCSKITIPFKIFVSNSIIFHPVCSSIFVSKEWIEALYLADASRYGTLDFRTTASSQFKLLASFCLLSQNTISQNQIELDNNQTHNGYFAAYQTPTQFDTGTDDDSPSDINAVCGRGDPISAAGFFSISNSSHYIFHDAWSIPEPNTTLIKGFYGACTPIEAILASTFDCLYDIECLTLLSEYFPNLNQTSFNWSNVVLHSEHDNISVYNHLRDLFVNEWSTKINYSKYFDECAPSFCTYTTANPMNFSFALALLISLYGGLTLVFRLIALTFVKIPLKWQTKTANVDSVPFMERIRKLNQSLPRLNLFKDKNKRTKSNIKQQRIITCLYLILLSGSFLVLVLFTSLSTEIVTKTISHPSLNTYTNLRILHSKTLRCSCTNMAIPYETFISLCPTLHKVCSSEFIDPDWISIWEELSSIWAPVDWRNKAHGYLQLLSDLCQLANKTKNNAVSHFLLQSFVASNVLNETDFNIQMNATLNQFYHTTITYFDLLVETANLLIQVDQPYTGSVVLFWNIDDENLLVHIATNETTGDEWLELTFRLPEVVTVNSTVNTCLCANDPHCQSISAMYNNTYNPEHDYNHSLISIQASPLYEAYPSLFETRSLVYDPAVDRFPPNTSISTIVKNMMIEQWNPSLLYDKYYNSCAPSHCTYSERVRSKTRIGVLITLLSMIGGLTVSLHFLTPYLGKFIFHVRGLCTKKQQPSRANVNCTLSDRWKTKAKNLITLSYKTFVSLNIFLMRDFGNNIDQTTAQHLGRWATRLYIVLLSICFVILILYTIVQSRTIKETFDRPSFYQYKYIKDIYGDKLECSCSLIASPYDRFVDIQPIFHQICSITTQLLSEETFNKRLDSLIERSQPIASNTFARLFYLIRSVNHGNAIISMYGTNFEYIVPWADPYGSYAPTQALIYDEQCSCGLHSNCTTQANFIQMNPLKLIPIKGLKMGCTPSESFLVSTLECFYDQTCLNLIQQYTNHINSSKPLSTTASRFSINTTINKLIDDLFVEQWTTTINYSSYFQQCSPLLCSYTYIQHFNLLYTITLILGLEGGLTIVLQWVCPTIVQIIFKIYQSRKKRKHPVQQISSIEMPDKHVEHSSFQCSLKIILICILLMITITGLAIFSIYIRRLDVQINTTNNE